MRDFRLAALKRFRAPPDGRLVRSSTCPTSTSTTSTTTSSRRGSRSRNWNELPDAHQETPTRKAGHPPRPSRKYLAGVTAQYESEGWCSTATVRTSSPSVVLFCDMDTAVREYPELVRKYFRDDHPPERQQVRRPQLGGVVGEGRSSTSPRAWSSDQPLQAYFRIQRGEHGPVFERTLIIADKGSQVALRGGVLGSGVHD